MSQIQLIFARIKGTLIAAETSMQMVGKSFGAQNAGYIYLYLIVPPVLH